ncbi:hypothetical protein LXL04_015065 [Taraxacum kok-saghyz]
MVGYPLIRWIRGLDQGRFAPNPPHCQLGEESILKKAEIHHYCLSSSLEHLDGTQQQELIYSRKLENSSNFLYLPDRYSIQKTDFGTLQNVYNHYNSLNIFYEKTIFFLNRFFGIFFATGLVFERFLAIRSRFFEKVNGLRVLGLYIWTLDAHTPDYYKIRHFLFIFFRIYNNIHKHKQKCIFKKLNVFTHFSTYAHIYIYHVMHICMCLHIRRAQAYGRTRVMNVDELLEHLAAVHES